MAPVPPHPMSDPRTRSLLVDAGLAVDAITTIYRPSNYASLLDVSDPTHPVIILNPEEHPDVLMAECAEQCVRILDEATERLAVAVNDDAGPATGVTARARRRAFEVVQGGAS